MQLDPLAYPADMTTPPEVRNPFLSPEGAGRYALGRPYFHPLFMARLSPLLRGRALGADVACGTGLSSLALADVVQEVRAFDLSAAMLAHAPAHSRITFVRAPAEALPLPGAALDVLTVAQAFHWFDRAAFLAEARRTLRPGGVLFVYDDFFVGQMSGQPDFPAFMSAYGERYPTPPRHRTPFGEADARAAGFDFHEERFTHTLPLTQAELVAYLLTHSNTLAATDSGRETTAQVRDWLEAGLRPFYPATGDQGAGRRDLHFLGWFMALRRG